MTGQPGDEAEILALIHANTVAYHMRDFEAWQRCYAHEPYLARWGWWRRGGIFVRHGWDDISARFRRELTEYPEPHPKNAYETRIEKLSLRVVGDVAWATFEQHYPTSDLPGRESGSSVPNVLHELRVCERIEGQWKIVVSAFLSKYDERGSEKRLILDGEARIVRASDAALALLADDDDLVIRNGKLRVRDKRADQFLQQTLRKAAEVDRGYFSAQAALPIVIDAGAGLPTRVWWVVADEGLISFSFGTHAASQDRLEMAAHIFDLSPTQTTLAGLLAEGLPLPEIAERMGVTHNTARTHLRRIYEKTGVQTQTALIRVLLSTTSPL